MMATENQVKGKEGPGYLNEGVVVLLLHSISIEAEPLESQLRCSK